MQAEGSRPSRSRPICNDDPVVSQIVCPTIVGRDEEWSRLIAALDGVEDGHGGLICVMGEAGIGKSRLVTELCTTVRERGVSVLMGRAVDTGTPVPFRPLFEALSGHFRRAGASDHPGLEPIRATLAQLVPEWRRPGEEIYRASPMELGEAILRLLSGIADSHGCVLVLEDLHWADPDTAAVLEYIGDNIGSVPVLCVATLRPDATTPALRVVRELASRRNATILELRRLTATDLAAMTQLCLGTATLPDDIEALVRRFSDGLPFLVEELLSSAVSAGSLSFGREGWHLEGGGAPVIPDRFTELIRRRLGLLTEDAARALTAAAVLGPRFDAGLLPIITGLSMETTTQALRDGIAAQLLVADPADARTFGFRHALTRDSLLDQLLPFERVEVSGRALAALESHYPELPGAICDVAAALAEAIGNRERAAELLLLSARRAYAQGALSSAEPMLGRAWEHADSATAVWLEDRQSVDDRADQHRQHRSRPRGRARGCWPRRSAPADRARTHLAMARAAAAASRWHLATEHVEQGRAAAKVSSKDEQLSAIADAIAAEVAIGQDRFDEAAALARAALRSAERRDDHELAAEALLVLGRCARVRGRRRSGSSLRSRDSDRSRSRTSDVGTARPDGAVISRHLALLAEHQDPGRA